MEEFHTLYDEFRDFEVQHNHRQHGRFDDCEVRAIEIENSSPRVKLDCGFAEGSISYALYEPLEEYLAYVSLVAMLKDR